MPKRFAHSQPGKIALSYDLGMKAMSTNCLVCSSAKECNEWLKAQVVCPLPDGISPYWIWVCLIDLAGMALSGTTWSLRTGHSWCVG